MTEMTEMMNEELNLEDLEQVNGGGKLGKKFAEAAAPWGVAAVASACCGLEPAAVGCGLIYAGLTLGAMVF